MFLILPKIIIDMSWEHLRLLHSSNDIKRQGAWIHQPGTWDSGQKRVTLFILLIELKTTDCVFVLVVFSEK